MKRNLLVLSIAFALQNSLSAQTTFTNNLSFRSNLFYGKVVPEYSQVAYLVDKSITGSELGFIKRTSGKNSWERAYHYPEYGLTLFYTSLGNNKVFGNEWALFPSIHFYMINKPVFQLVNELGFGLGYATRKFDIRSNYQNVSVGSHFNAHFNFKLNAKFVLTGKISLNSGFSFSHFSNANMAEPNLGLNLFYLYAGINYAIGQKMVNEDKTLEEHLKKHELALVISPGGKHTRALQSKVYFTSSASAEYKYHWKRKFHMGGGLDIFYDSGTKTEMSVTNNTYRSAYDFKSGIHISQELVYNPFSLILQEGIYVGLTDHLNNGWQYNRAIVRWKFSDHFFVNVSMKTHLNILDYPEVGFGFYVVNK